MNDYGVIITNLGIHSWKAHIGSKIWGNQSPKIIHLDQQRRSSRITHLFAVSQTKVVDPLTDWSVILSRKFWIQALLPVHLPKQLVPRLCEFRLASYKHSVSGMTLFLVQLLLFTLLWGKHSIFCARASCWGISELKTRSEKNECSLLMFCFCKMFSWFVIRRWILQLQTSGETKTKRGL